MRVGSLMLSVPIRHANALRWFADRCDTEQAWPAPLDHAGTLLASKAKGIYKPRWSDYALSVRHSILAPYEDGRPTIEPNGHWAYRYFQENRDIPSRDREYTNRGMLRCISDRVPVGVMLQVAKKPSRYYILGLAIVSNWADGYFELVGITPVSNLPSEITASDS